MVGHTHTHTHTAVDGCNAFTEVNLVDGAGSTPAKRAWIRLSVGTERRALTDVDAAQLLAVEWHARTHAHTNTHRSHVSVPRRQNDAEQGWIAQKYKNGIQTLFFLKI